MWEDAMKKVVLGLMCMFLAVSVQVQAGVLDKGSFSKEGGFEDRYVPPLSNPIYNETPYITTEASLWYLYQVIPEKSITQGGHINLGAA